MKASREFTEQIMLYDQFKTNATQESSTYYR